MFDDFEQFKSDISWFIKPTDKVKLSKSSIGLTPEFAITFPILSQLIERARVLSVEINKDSYRLYSWTNTDQTVCGWLCKLEPENVADIPIIPEHQLLLNNIGGIQESFNQPDDAFSNNQNFLFIKSECTRGLQYWNEYYTEMCEEAKAVLLPVDNLISFVGEANGNQTLYDLHTKEIYLFAHDHCFDYVTFMEGQPEYTFHRINGVKNFADYVETLATQWTNYIN